MKIPLNRNAASAVAHRTSQIAMRLTPSERTALAPYLDRLNDDDLLSIVGQFRHLAQTARDRRLTGKPVVLPIIGDPDWYEWRSDLRAAGVIVARIRNRDVTDETASAYAETYMGAAETVRVIYLPDADGACPALDDLDALEAARESDPAAAW